MNERLLRKLMLKIRLVSSDPGEDYQVAYTRGDRYIWSSMDEDEQEFIHFWCKHDVDSTASSSVWNTYDDGREPIGAIVLPQKFFDELVAMRWAEMSIEEKAHAQQRAMDNWGGNAGSLALLNQLGVRYDPQTQTIIPKET